MIRHLTPADYRVQRWANGRGETVEIARDDGPGGLRWRLSVAQVVEDGPFSRFPGIARSLTVIEGPGFLIRGRGLDLRADPMVPVAFPGGADVRAEGVTGPSRDFNVMTDETLPAPQVWLAQGQIPASGFLALYALSSATVKGAVLRQGHTLLTDAATTVRSGRVLAVRLPD